MSKVAIIVLADTESHGDLGRVVNALEAVKEFKEAKDTIKLIFDGAGTKWIANLSNPDHRLHGLFDSVRDKIAGACSFCAVAFGAKEAADAQGISLLGEYDGHPSIQPLVSEGYHIITY